MFFRVMDKSRLPDLVRGLSAEYEVVGPVAKGDTFVFSTVDDPSVLRLDYDTTIEDELAKLKGTYVDTLPALVSVPTPIPHRAKHDSATAFDSRSHPGSSRR